jgi:hypothetical protein
MTDISQWFDVPQRKFDVNTTSDRKMGIIDSATGEIKFVSRDEGYRQLGKSAKRLVAKLPVELVKLVKKVKKEKGT